MKYLRVEYNEDSKPTIEGLAYHIKKNYPKLVSSVEICDDEEPKFPEIKMSEVGVLDINIPDKFYISDNSMSFYDGDPVDLEHYPELRRFCKDIKTEWNLTEDLVGSLVVVDYGTHCESGYFRFNSEGKPQISPFNNGHQNCKYICDDAISIRIVEEKR